MTKPLPSDVAHACMGLAFQSYEAKGNFNKAKEICPMVQLLIAADGLASQVLEGK